MRVLRLFVLLGLVTCSSACVLGKVFVRNVGALASTPEKVPNRIQHPVRKDARLAALWIGHATVLVQMDDKMILTDPVFTKTVAGGFSKRLVEPGIDPKDLPPIDVTLISHMHFDHLSLGSLDILEPKIKQLLVPEEGLVYLPNYRFGMHEVSKWQTVDIDGVQVTAVPVSHPGFRYGADAAWMKKSATAWLFTYHGFTVYFGGDTAYDAASFRETGKRFSKIDLALLPISPIEPPSFARATHVDGREALKAFKDLGAGEMIPIHFDTFPHGIDPAGYATNVLREGMKEQAVTEERVHILQIGEQYAWPRAVP
jgi:N-acyl-phosphatidylethanolamine-hydrolysing phospholipase D